MESKDKYLTMYEDIARQNRVISTIRQEIEHLKNMVHSMKDGKPLDHQEWIFAKISYITGELNFHQNSIDVININIQSIIERLEKLE